MPDIERDTPLARVFVVELATHIRISDAAQRPGGLFARGASAHRGHGRHTGIRMAFQLDFNAFGAKRT